MKFNVYGYSDAPILGGLSEIFKTDDLIRVLHNQLRDYESEFVNGAIVDIGCGQTTFLFDYINTDRKLIGIDNEQFQPDQLKNRLDALPNTQNEVWFDIRPIAVAAIQNLCEIDKLWEDADNEGKRYLVGMLYPERLTYVNGKHRTGKMNEAAEWIYLKNKELRAKKMGQKSVFQTLPHEG